ncbi:bifunctional 2-polyprenyl-6-hydroxyphenol methylase/3-demethylubiquinol 3-O-methyltransferase UbiG [Mycobacterium sp.]|uniref:class I SAM-dependent methyltransferase n=1 Tax=Mycobacterium sp. TaxID=1785 RepID=UPI00127E96C3|nr:class I SAM-dependent methyltransferase [Mycobacterium sp.]KAA8964450.1 MAG: methyltransferase domain-containing protein [Mycobacterium sp.]
MDNGIDSGTNEARQFWEERYGGTDRVWSGRVNARLAEVAAGMTPGSALDLGCGEGADVLWLAEKGWHVVGVDISENALRRAAAEARARNITDRIDFQRHDLSESFPDGTFDLVSAQYLHSPARLDRDAILRRAAASVKPGGVLLIVDHAEAPPWMRRGNHHQHHDFPSTGQVIESLQLDRRRWQQVRVETAERETAGPDGQPATLRDNIIVLRRLDGQAAS